MKNKLLFLLFFIGTYMSYGQHNISFFIKDAESQNPLPGATAHIESLKLGSSADANGMVTLQDVPKGTYAVTFQFIGYQPLKRRFKFPSPEISDTITIWMEEDAEELEEIIISSTRSSRTIDDIPTRIEFIGGEELAEKTAMNATNISMVLRESTGIQMQQTSLSSANSTIRIQGLDGRFTQLLKDGFPLYGGFAGTLSIMQIPPLDLKQFEIIKGSSSTLYGGGAIAGLVNMISKTPEDEPDFDIMLTQTHALGSTANMFYSQRGEKTGFTLYGSANYQRPYDPDNDDFSNLPLTKSLNFNPKFFYYPDETSTLMIGLNGTYDNRIGGDIIKITKGEQGIHQYTEENLSKRVSSQLSYDKSLNENKKLSFKNSFSFYDRRLLIPNYTFAGTQWNSFSELDYKQTNERSEWILGGNLYSSSFNEDADTLEKDQKDITLGVYTNYIYNITDKWILESGLRTDYSPDWEAFVLPRISLLFRNNKHFSSRIGGGFGYKLPDIFTEDAEYLNYQNIVPINKSVLQPERSYGANLDFNYQASITSELGVSVNQLFYATAIKNSLLLTAEEDYWKFTNAPDIILSKGSETNIKFTWNDFRWFINYAFIDARLHYLPGNPQKPLTAKHNAGTVLMYEGETWRFGYEVYYTGSQILPDQSTTSDFILMGFLAVHNFEWGNIFANFENFTDRRQSRFGAIAKPPHEAPVFSSIWAPTDGFIFSLGVTIMPFGNHHH